MLDTVQRNIPIGDLCFAFVGQPLSKMGVSVTIVAKHCLGVGRLTLSK